MIKLPYQKKLNIPLTFPTPLSYSRDYNAIETLLYTIFNYFYTESVESKNIHNPRRCDNELLPMLADYYRYSYTDVENIELEREIIATVPELHHNKGCKVGIDNALELSKVNKSSEIKLPWFYNKENNVIIVILFKNVKCYKLKELLRLVVPLGTKVIYKSGVLVQSEEEIKLHSWTEYNSGLLDDNKQHYVQKNNFWSTIWDEDKQQYSTYVDTQWELSNPNNKDPQGKGEDGATRVGNSEIASNSRKDS